MNKKGFISVTIVFSFFILFMMILLSTLTIYAFNRKVVDISKNQQKEELQDVLYNELNEINNQTDDTNSGVFWNDGFEGTRYSYPSKPEKTSKNPEYLEDFLNKPYYINTTDTGYQACLNYDGKEFCLNGDYWDKTESNLLDQADKTIDNLKTDMEEKFGLDSVQCGSSSQIVFYRYDAICYINSSPYFCMAHANNILDTNGGVACGYNNTNNACIVTTDNQAVCRKTS